MASNPPAEAPMPTTQGLKYATAPLVGLAEASFLEMRLELAIADERTPQKITYIHMTLFSVAGTGSSKSLAKEVFLDKMVRAEPGQILHLCSISLDEGKLPLHRELNISRAWYPHNGAVKYAGNPHKAAYRLCTRQYVRRLW